MDGNKNNITENMKIFRIDVSQGTIADEAVPDAYRLLGGRGFSSRWIAAQAPPDCEPLGAHNPLIVAPGLLAGTPASSVNRLSTGAKSPLTQGIKESNAGGNVALKLARLGIKALVFEGDSEAAGRHVVHVSEQGIRIESGDDLTGLGTEASAQKLHQRYGAESALMVVGPAGEMQMPTAAILSSDREGFPARVCGRGGMGAVMGAKGIKAVVIDDAGTRPVPLADSRRFKDAAKTYMRLLTETPQTSEIYTKFGTAAMTDLVEELGGLPTRNFSRGRFEGAEKITGRTLYRTITERGGDPSHACMPGCVICSSNIYVDKTGRQIVRSLEYETLVLFGPNCDIDDLDELARINQMCNDIGIDTIDLGVAVGIAMDAGLLSFGDIHGVKDLIGQVRKGTVLGRVLGAGAAVTGRVLGVRRIPAVKGQAMAAYEPRAIKGHGVTFATATMGADHTAGFTIREGLDAHDKQGQVTASARMQVNAMLYDSLGVCLFAHVAVRDHHHTLAEMVNGRWGTELSEQDLRRMAIAGMNTERDFNRSAGLGPATDRLPEFCNVPNPSSKTVFDISTDELNRLTYE